VHAFGRIHRGVQRLDRDRRRRQVRIATPEVDEPRTGLRASSRSRSDDSREVLLGKPGEEPGAAVNVQDV
jgi:hypothetical protein